MLLPVTGFIDKPVSAAVLRQCGLPLARQSSRHVRRRMAERGKHRVAPVPALAKKQYAYVPCPRSEEVGTDFALHLLRHHEPDRPETPLKSPPGELKQCTQSLKSLEFSGKVRAFWQVSAFHFQTVFFIFRAIYGKFKCQSGLILFIQFNIFATKDEPKGSCPVPTRFLLVF